MYCFPVPQDPVYSIREAAIHVLQAVAKEFGPDWAREHIVPQVGGWAGGCACGVLPSILSPPLPSLQRPAFILHVMSPHPHIVSALHVLPALPVLRALRVLPHHRHPVLLPPPQVLALVGSDNYLHRMTVLAAIGALSASVNKEVVHNSMLPAVVACSKVGAAVGAGRASSRGSRVQ